MDTMEMAQRYMRGEVMKRTSPRREAQRDEIMRMIFSKTGFGAVIAKHIGLTNQAVAAWDSVPPKYVMEVAELLGMEPEQIRPDIFGKPTRK